MNIRDTHPLGERQGERGVIERLAARLGISQPEAETVAGAVLAALEEHLAPLEAEALEAELPVPVRRAIHRVERPGREQHDLSHVTTAEELYRRVAGLLRAGPFGEAHPLIVTTCESLRPELSERVRAQVAARLSPELRALWLGTM